MGKIKIMCNKHVNKDDVIVDGKKDRGGRQMHLSWADVTKDHYQVQEMKRRIRQR